jgi:type VI secretion system protein ImpM
MSLLSPQISYFGKLPRFGDFIRYNAGGSEIRSMEQWIQEGIHYSQQQFSSDWDAVFTASPRYGFVFCPDGSDRFLLGVLMASRDKIGRRYPFVISLRLAKSALDGGAIFRLPLAYSAFLLRAGGLLNRLADESSVHDIAALANSLAVSTLDDPVGASDELDAYLRSTSLAAFWEAVLDDRRDRRKFLLMKNLVDILSPLRGNQPERLTLGLRFPLGRNRDRLHVIIGTWMRLCMRMLGDPILWPTFFWGREGPERPSYLYLFLSAPSYKNFTHLVYPQGESDILCRLEEEGGGDPTNDAERLEAESQGLPADDESLLLDFIKRF